MELYKGHRNHCIRNLEKGKITQQIQKKERIELYNIDPKKCLHCSIVMQYEDRRKKFCNSSCSASYNNARRKHSEETKKKISNAILGTVASEETKRKISEGWHSKSASEKERINALKSRIKKEQYQNGLRVSGGHSKWLKYETIDGVVLNIQGSYELRACKIFETMKLQKLIEDWEYTNERIEYIGIDKKSHMYLLDFKILKNGDVFYIEMKGYMRVNDQIKIDSARRQGLDVRLWFGDDLFEHEVQLNLTPILKPDDSVIYNIGI